tara:strand:+ start:4298 stop:5827 length:1530 start_codon:yes stop_codon:yes gene_type:complete
MARFINPIPQYTLSNGDIAAGGTLTFYESGTDTLLIIYADINESIPIANPITLGSRGEVPNIFFSSSARCVFNDSNDNQIFDVDPVNSSIASGEFEIWNSNIVYTQSNIVFGSNGNIYISLIVENQGNNPILNAGNNQFWAQLILPEAWNSQVIYTPNEFAIENGIIFRSLISNNTGNQPSLDNGSQWKSIANGIYVDYNNTSSGLLAVTAQAAIDEIVALINNLPSSVVYRGQLDVSAGNSALPAAPQNGDLYVIAVGGTITVSTAGATPVLTAVNTGEQIIYNGDDSQWDLISSVQQAATVSYNNAASGLSATNVQNAIDEVEGRIDTAETNIVNNDNDIATNAGNITANANNIATNASNIINNASNIATNTSNIATNTSNISTNTSGISTNASNIAANTASVVAIQKTYLAATTQTFGRLAVNTYIQHSNWTGASVSYELETSQFLLGDKVYINREFTESGTTTINAKSGNLIYLPDKSSNQIQTLEATGTIRLIKITATVWVASA